LIISHMSIVPHQRTFPPPQVQDIPQHDTLAQRRGGAKMQRATLTASDYFPMHRKRELGTARSLDAGLTGRFVAANRSARSCSQPQRRDHRGRAPRLRNSQDDIGAGAPVQFFPVRLLQLQQQRRHSPQHDSWRQNRSERCPDHFPPMRLELLPARYIASAATESCEERDRCH
jgi:hypothetical protein